MKNVPATFIRVQDVVGASVAGASVDASVDVVTEKTIKKLGDN